MASLGSGQTSTKELLAEIVIRRFQIRNVNQAETIRNCKNQAMRLDNITLVWYPNSVSISLKSKAILKRNKKGMFFRETREHVGRIDLYELTVFLRKYPSQMFDRILNASMNTHEHCEKVSESISKMISLLSRPVPQVLVLFDEASCFQLKIDPFSQESFYYLHPFPNAIEFPTESSFSESPYEFSLIHFFLTFPFHFSAFCNFAPVAEFWQLIYNGSLVEWFLFQFQASGECGV